jgi:hypothetical protein
LLAVAVLALSWAHDTRAQATPSEDLVWALHVSISPSWFDPGENEGTYAYGGYPDIDEFFQQQRQERDRAKQEALLHHIQQLTVERVMFAPIMDLRGLTGVGPRVAEHTINSIPLHPGPAFQNIRLKGQ